MAPPRQPDYDDDGPGWAEFDPRDYDDEPDEPIGSCEWCGTNLYPWNASDLCDQCEWGCEQNRGGDGGGIQPIM